MSEQFFKGSSTNAGAPFLGSDFWKKDVSIAGEVERVFVIEGRHNWTLQLSKPVEIEGERCDRVNVSESAGIRMAMQDARLRDLREGDQLTLVCTGETPSKNPKKSPRIDFEIAVSRPEVEENIPEYAR